MVLELASLEEKKKKERKKERNDDFRFFSKFVFSPSIKLSRNQRTYLYSGGSGLSKDIHFVDIEVSYDEDRGVIIQSVSIPFLFLFFFHQKICKMFLFTSFNYILCSVAVIPWAALGGPGLSRCCYVLSGRSRCGGVHLASIPLPLGCVRIHQSRHTYHLINGKLIAGVTLLGWGPLMSFNWC